MRRREAEKEALKEAQPRPPDAWSGNPPPGPRPHRTPGRRRPEGPDTRTHTAHAPRGLDDVTRQGYARRRFSQCGGPGVLVFCRSSGYRGWEAPASFPTAAMATKAARANRAPFGPAPSVKRAGQTCAGHVGSAHLAPDP